MGSIAIAAWNTNECIECTARNDNILKKIENNNNNNSQRTFKLYVMYDSCTIVTDQQ